MGRRLDVVQGFPALRTDRIVFELMVAAVDHLHLLGLRASDETDAVEREVVVDADLCGDAGLLVSGRGDGYGEQYDAIPVGVCGINSLSLTA